MKSGHVVFLNLDANIDLQRALYCTLYQSIIFFHETTMTSISVKVEIVVSVEEANVLIVFLRWKL